MNLAFQFGIGGDFYPVKFEDHLTGVKPFLQHQALEQQQGRIGLTAFGAFAGMVKLLQQLFDGLPVDGCVELFEHAQGTILIGKGFDGQIGEGKVVLGFSISHGGASYVGWD